MKPALHLASSVLLCAGLLASQTACFAKQVKWTEEVQLSNGQMIVVERETKHRPGGAEWPTGTGWRPQEYLIRFKYPPGTGPVIEWRSTKMDIERNIEPEYPLLLDIEPPKDSLVIITFQGLRGFCFGYVRYVFNNGGWSEIPLPAEFEPREANLYLPAAALDIPKHVLLPLKQKENAGIHYSNRFKQIGPKQKDCRA